MPLNPTPPRGYKAIVSKNGLTLAFYEMITTSRRKAVLQALTWFWYTYRGSLGQAGDVMTINDPYYEVRYGPHFICSDRLNKLLPPDVCTRVIAESKGELELSTRTSSPYHPLNSLKRVKRRRDFGRMIAPNIKRMKNGVMYYRMTVIREKRCGEQIIQNRKVRDVRLKARSIAAAIDEIKSRDLLIENRRAAGRNMKVRDLHFTAHVAGLLAASILTEDQEKKFSKVIKRYQMAI